MLLFSVYYDLVAKIQRKNETTKIKIKNNTRTKGKKHIRLRERQVSITNYSFIFDTGKDTIIRNS